MTFDGRASKRFALVDMAGEGRRCKPDLNDEKVLQQLIDKLMQKKRMKKKETLKITAALDRRICRLTKKMKRMIRDERRRKRAKAKRCVKKVTAGDKRDKSKCGAGRS